MVGHRFQSSGQLTQAQNASTLVNRVQEIKIAFLFLFATAILRWCSVNQINHVTIDTRERDENAVLHSFFIPEMKIQKIQAARNRLTSKKGDCICRTETTTMNGCSVHNYKQRRYILKLCAASSAIE